MGKGKKGGKRMNKAQLTEMLQEFFAERPGETLSLKEIFRSLRLTTHPLKMGVNLYGERLRMVLKNG